MKKKSATNNSSFGFNHTTISLFNDLRYNTRVVLDSVNMVMVCGYNNRTKLRWVSLETLDGVVILKRTPLKYGRRCELDPTAKWYNLDYYVTLKAKDVNQEVSDNYDYKNWSKDFDLCFVGKPYSSSLEIKQRYLNVIVGGSNG